MSTLAPVATRRYEQRLRAQSADETRRRILDAASDRLREAPSQPLNVDRVARTAGVARSTVYLVFGSRAGLFDALREDLVERSGLARLIEAVQHPDAREHLRGGIRAGAEMFAADRDLFRALTSMSALDDEAVGGAMRRGEAVRARGMARLARTLDEQGLLLDGLSAERAADVLWMLTSFDAFDLLYTGRGLPLDEVVEVLTETAERSVCRPAGARPSRPRRAPKPSGPAPGSAPRRR
jgi:AcrR family transcriptional regulator